jgi:hypothetical protein
MTDELFREIVATHEAGHAIVAAALGYRLRKVSLQDCRVVTVRLAPRPGGRWHFNDAVIAAAGPSAEVRAFGYSRGGWGTLPMCGATTMATSPPPPGGPMVSWPATGGRSPPWPTRCFNVAS